MKRYIWITRDWSGYLKLYGHDINNDYFWCSLLLLFIRLIIAKKQKKLKRILVVLQTNDVNTKVCSIHDTISLQYLIF